MGQRIATVVLFLTCSFEASEASAQQARSDRPTAASLGIVPYGVYMQVPARERPHRPGGAIAGRGGRAIVFLNGGGGTYDGSWWDDSTTNESSILNTSVHLSPYPYGDRSWSRLLDCMRAVYAPFNVEVTDVDPGNASHLEVVVSGHPRDIGQVDGVGGIAPMACDVIDNAVAYAFPETYGDDPMGICEAAAQESAHAFGLDHEMQCDDVMTYLWCGAEKGFQDVDAPCGEYRERSCACGGDTQNSYQYLMSILGPAEELNLPPTVRISSPSEGDEVEPGFAVEVEAADDRGLVSVELYIDGDLVDRIEDSPYRFTAPDELDAGEHELEVRVSDGANATQSDHVTVNLAPASVPDEDDDRDPTDDGPDLPGQLGDACEEASMCVSNACVTSEGYCTARCVDGDCADGFTCSETEDGEFCLLEEEGDRSRGCAMVGPIAEGTSSPILALTLLGALGLVARRRRPLP